MGTAAIHGHALEDLRWPAQRQGVRCGAEPLGRAGPVFGRVKEKRPQQGNRHPAGDACCGRGQELTCVEFVRVISSVTLAGRTFQSRVSVFACRDARRTRRASQRTGQALSHRWLKRMPRAWFGNQGEPDEQHAAHPAVQDCRLDFVALSKTSTLVGAIAKSDLAFADGRHGSVSSGVTSTGRRRLPDQHPSDVQTTPTWSARNPSLVGGLARRRV